MKRFRFTLVDDDANMLFLLRHMLSKAFPGSSIAAFSSGEDALTHVLESGTDLLVTDHAMGRMNDAQLIRELRNRNASLPILMLSGSDHASEEARRAGATRFLEKKTSMKTIETCIRSLLDS
jgi:two-component system C4-dicarboxylate transport response regulator DctD